MAFPLPSADAGDQRAARSAKLKADREDFRTSPLVATWASGGTARSDHAVHGESALARRSPSTSKPLGPGPADLRARQVEIADRRWPGQRPRQLVEIATLLPPSEVVLVVFARWPALHQDEVIGVVEVGRDFHTWQPSLLRVSGSKGRNVSTSCMPVPFFAVASRMTMQVIVSPFRPTFPYARPIRTPGLRLACSQVRPACKGHCISIQAAGAALVL